MVLDYSYNAAADRTGLSATVDGVLDFQNSYTYDALHRVTRIEQLGQTGGNAVAEKRVDFAYNGISQYTSIARYAKPAGAWAEVATGTYAYDSLDRLTALDYTLGVNPVSSYAWTHDKLGRITQSTLPEGTSTFAYDAASQLTSATHSYLPSMLPGKAFPLLTAAL